VHGLTGMDTKFPSANRRFAKWPLG